MNTHEEREDEKHRLLMKTDAGCRWLIIFLENFVCILRNLLSSGVKFRLLGAQQAEQVPRKIKQAEALYFSISSRRHYPKSARGVWDLALYSHTFQHAFPTRVLPQQQTHATTVDDVEQKKQQQSSKQN